MDVTIVLPGRTKWCGKQQHKSFIDKFLIPFISLSSKTIDHLTSLKGYLLLFFNNKCDVIITVAQEIVAPYKHTYTHTHMHARMHKHTFAEICLAWTRCMCGTWLETPKSITEFPNHLQWLISFKNTWVIQLISVTL